jgi:hypothetical protein
MNYFQYKLKLSEFNSIVKQFNQNLYGKYPNKSHLYSELDGTNGAHGIQQLPAEQVA